MLALATLTFAGAILLHAETPVQAASGVQTSGAAEEGSYYLSEYVEQFQDLNNGSVSVSMDTDGRYRLQKQDNSEFKILQITDFHLTGYDLDGGYGNDRNLTVADTREVLEVYRLVENTRPDLIVMTGDVIYGGDFNTFTGNKRALHTVIQLMNKMNIPWVYIMGNHDHFFADGRMGTGGKAIFMNELAQATTLMYYPDHPTFKEKGGIAEEFLYGTYKLINQDDSLNSVVVALDTGTNTQGTGDYDHAYDAQVDWYKEELRNIAADADMSVLNLKSYMYYHIPLPVVRDVLTGRLVPIHYGKQLEMPCPSIYAGKLWEAVQELGSTKTMSFGHDHVNDTWFTYKGVDFIYGKSIEYTVYADDAVTGGAQRGASEIHVRQNGSYYITENSLNEIEKNTAVMQEDGSWKYVDENHKVDASYTGAAWNGYTWVMFQPERVDASETGIKTVDGRNYIVCNGEYYNLAYIFNPKDYADLNPDLKAAFGYDEEQLIRHFINYGRYEGRKTSFLFDPVFYSNMYPELKEKFGENWSEYYDYFMNNGLYNGDQASLYFDYNFYKNANTDLQHVYGDNVTAYLDHFMKYGLKEGRQGAISFDVAFYRDSYADLLGAFGNDVRRYYLHYSLYGRKEGRIITAQFDATSYLQNNPDVQTTSGDSSLAAYRHFKENGISEGRQGSPIFNWADYRELNADLRATYGSNTYLYFKHFSRYGMKEGRQTARTFNPSIYKNRYADLKAAFGTEYSKYYRHYLRYGMAEGRIAV